MLGRALVPCLQARGHETTGLDRDALDITVRDQVLEVVGALKPDFVINAAAYTAVDLAETESETAFKVNRDGSENLAIACKKADIPLLYVSTDYVFDGTASQPYQPSDKTNPLSVYGKSKLAGEQAVQNHLSRYYITRTSWLYGLHGKNFVDTMLQLASKNSELKVVADQTGSPTSTVSLSNIIADLITSERWGTYHATDDGVTTWCDFAREILKNTSVKLLPCTTEEFPRPAPRPRYSVLDKTSLTAAIGHELTPWQEALKEYLGSRCQMQTV